MLNFIFGKRGLASTPQELAERREMERAIQARSAGRVPQDPWEGLNSIAQAIGSRVEDSRLDEAETEGRAGADDKFRSLFKAGAPGATAASPPTVTPTSYSPEEQTGSPGLPGIAKAWLDTIAGPESAGAYDTLYGGTKFADFSDHPGANIPIISGPNKGKTSSAAGKYQFLAPTWEEQQAKLKLPDFSPASQDAAAWNLAQETYKAKTGKDLRQALESADDAGIVEIARLLSGTWTSLPGGIEQGIDDQGFVSKYRQNLQSGQGQPATARQPVQMAQNGNGFDPALVDAYSDPWMSEGQRDVLKLYIQQQLQNADPKTKLELRKMGLEIDALENPTPEYGFTVLPDGRMVRTDKAKGTAEPIMTSEPKPTDDVAEYEYYSAQAKAAGQQPMPFEQWQVTNKKAGASNFNMGGGSDKQVFDAMNESAVSARSAVNGLNSLREAKKAIAGGVITGAWANERLTLQKIGAWAGVADPSTIENTETFRSAIAPQVAALMKATVGSTQISNADREFAEKAAGGAITLDERTITRLIDIMERAGTVAVKSHIDRLDKVYPDQKGFDRERALFGVELPPEEQAPPPSSDRKKQLMDKYGIGRP